MYVPEDRGKPEASNAGGAKTKQSKKAKSDTPEPTTRGVERSISSKDTVVSGDKPSGQSQPSKPNQTKTERETNN